MDRKPDPRMTAATDQVIAEVKDRALTFRAVFVTYTAAGFSEDQAMQLTLWEAAGGPMQWAKFATDTPEGEPPRG